MLKSCAIAYLKDARGLIAINECNSSDWYMMW